MNNIAKKLLKTHVLPPFIPVFRRFIQDFPNFTGKRSIVRKIGPRIVYADYPFEVPTCFGAKMKGNTKDIIDRYIYFFGIWEPSISAFISRRLAPGDVFVDVGANVGYFSLVASSIVGAGGGVVAIEASPNIFRILEGNIALNSSQTSNIRIANVAASDQRGTLRLYYGTEYNRGTTSIYGNDGSVLEAEVPSLPLTDILEHHEQRRARIIKIDVEGAEGLVSRGLGSLLTHGRDDLEVLMEVNPEWLAARGYSTESLVGMFTDAMFYPYALANDYSFESYIPPRRQCVPTRIRGPIHEQTDIVFSRIDAEKL